MPSGPQEVNRSSGFSRDASDDDAPGSSAASLNTVPKFWPSYQSTSADISAALQGCNPEFTATKQAVCQDMAQLFGALVEPYQCARHAIVTRMEDH
jgi:hypothetical protein